MRSPLLEAFKSKYNVQWIRKPGESAPAVGSQAGCSKPPEHCAESMVLGSRVSVSKSLWFWDFAVLRHVISVAPVRWWEGRAGQSRLRARCRGVRSSSSTHPSGLSFHICKVEVTLVAPPYSKGSVFPHEKNTHSTLRSGWHTEAPQAGYILIKLHLFLMVPILTTTGTPSAFLWRSLNGTPIPRRSLV